MLAWLDQYDARAAEILDGYDFGSDERGLLVSVISIDAWSLRGWKYLVEKGEVIVCSATV